MEGQGRCDLEGALEGIPREEEDDPLELNPFSWATGSSVNSGEIDEASLHRPWGII